MMLNANLKSTTVMLITKNIILLFLGNHILHNFTGHVEKHSNLLCTIRGLISLFSSLTQSQTANNTTDVGHVLFCF